MAGRIIVCPKCNERIEQKLLIEKQKLLIVEGRDEEEFFGALLKKLGINDIQVVGVGGKTLIKTELGVLKDDPLFVQRVISLGIVRDADSDAKAAFQSVQKALKDAGLPYPRKIIAPVQGPPKVTVMILPPNQKKGALEDLCLKAVNDDPAMFCVDQFFECLDARGSGRPTKDFAKAKTRVFLSSRKDPTLTLGLAAGKGYWPFDTRVFNSIEKFLKSL